MVIIAPEANPQNLTLRDFASEARVEAFYIILGALWNGCLQDTKKYPMVSRTLH